MCWYTKENGAYVYHTNADETAPIEELDMTVRAYKYYRERGISSIHDLTVHDGWFFLDLGLFSTSIFSETIRCLDRAGFRLSDCGDEEYPTVDAYIAYFKGVHRNRIQAAHKEELRLERNERARIRYRERRSRSTVGA